ncbi:MAG TPA: bifunctional riboflavin kinase/FAD synthetase [Oligoflexia bacterium]|nr:bifunctional riboflavin kinase/FAD synthetase [Oligoflexia bacterium]
MRGKVSQEEDSVQDFLSTSCDSASCVTVGNFDGVHVGHMQLIDKLHEIADQNKLRSIALTFSPHPGEFFSKKSLKLLMPLKTRVYRLKKAGVDQVKVIEFSKSFSKLSYIEFLDHLIEHYQLKQLIIGKNTHIGKARQGSPEKIKDYLEKKQIQVTVLEIHKVEGDYVSSSKIREYVAQGAIDKANQLLGYAYVLSGPVVKGSGQGTGLGFPTANLNYQKDLCIPKNGVYRTTVELDGKKLPALTNIGQAPTIKNSKETTIESYIPQYKGMALYGKVIKLNFYERIRAEKKFSSIEALQEQIKKDLDKLDHFIK